MTTNERLRYMRGKRNQYPYIAFARLGVRSPEKVSYKEYGHFCYIPFPGVNYAVWMFQTSEAADRFREKYGLRVRERTAP